MNDEQCESCRFRHGLLVLEENGRWRPEARKKEFPDGMTEAEYEERYEEGSGICRRLPPTHQGFPLVCLDDWCGEYQPKKG